MQMKRFVFPHMSRIPHMWHERAMSYRAWENFTVCLLWITGAKRTLAHCGLTGTSCWVRNAVTLDYFSWPCKSEWFIFWWKPSRMEWRIPYLTLYCYIWPWFIPNTAMVAGTVAVSVLCHLPGSGAWRWWPLPNLPCILMWLVLGSQKCFHLQIEERLVFLLISLAICPNERIWKHF